MWEAAALGKGPSGMAYLEEYLQWEVKIKDSDKRGDLSTYDMRPRQAHSGITLLEFCS